MVDEKVSDRLSHASITIEEGVYYQNLLEDALEAAWLQAIVVKTWQRPHSSNEGSSSGRIRIHVPLSSADKSQPKKVQQPFVRR